MPSADRKKPITSHAMTLLEMVLALSVLAILMAVAQVSFRTTMINHDLRCAAQVLVDDLHLVREQAISDQQTRTWNLNTANGNYSVFHVPDLRGRRKISGNIIEEYDLDNIGSTSGTLTLSISFDHRGMSDFAGHIILIKGKRNAVVTIDNLGMVSWSRQ